MAAPKADTFERIELERRLRHLLAPEDEQSTALLVEVLTTPVAGAVSDSAKAAARTRQYKVRQILAGSPESGDVVAACGYMVLNLFRRMPDHVAVSRLIGQLEKAGFDADESKKVIHRLAENAKEREVGWRKQIKIRQSTRLARAIKQTEAVSDQSES